MGRRRTSGRTALPLPPRTTSPPCRARPSRSSWRAMTTWSLPLTPSGCSPRWPSPLPSSSTPFPPSRLSPLPHRHSPSPTPPPTPTPSPLTARAAAAQVASLRQDVRRLLTPHVGERHPGGVGRVVVRSVQSARQVQLVAPLGGACMYYHGIALYCEILVDLRNLLVCCSSSVSVIGHASTFPHCTGDCSLTCDGVHAVMMRISGCLHRNLLRKSKVQSVQYLDATEVLGAYHDYFILRRPQNLRSY